MGNKDWPYSDLSGSKPRPARVGLIAREPLQSLQNHFKAASR